MPRVSECTYSVDSARHTREGRHGRLRGGGGMCRSNVRNTAMNLGDISENWVCMRPNVSSIWPETGFIQHRDLVMVMAEGPSRLGSLSGYSRQGWSTSVEEEGAQSERERGLINRDQYCFARFLPLITYDKAGGAAALDGKSLMRASRSTRNKLYILELDIETKTTIST